jgi:demethylmenaquinone methyltransferase / 2-methoxy-6-polyprenyl-1,4-benzoquinol methylase
MTPDPVPPHPTLPQYYRTDAERPQMVRDLFDEGAPYYEWVCRAMSLGSGEWYRGRVLAQAGLTEGSRLLDVATGTGLMLRSGRALCGRAGLSVGLDPSRGMLRECRASCDAGLIQARGESLPFGDDSFDMVSMGYALRHVTDLRVLFSEFRRVLTPGGRVVVLELTQPRSRAGRWMNRIYMGTIVPRVAHLGTGSASARRMMEYFWETIEHCVPPEAILAALADAGFAEPRRRVTGVVLSEYSGVSPR